ncbi:hypothetical protein Dimus_038363 [Dionaea muscipula]
MHFAQTVRGARRWCSITRRATRSAPSADSSSSPTPLTRPPSGGPSPTSPTTMIPPVSADHPTPSSPTADSSPSSPRPTVNPVTSPLLPLAAGRIAVPILIALSSSLSRLLLPWPIGLVPLSPRTIPLLDDLDLLFEIYLVWRLNWLGFEQSWFVGVVVVVVVEQSWWLII